MYTAAVLTTQARSQLLALLAGQIPETFEVIAHHLTIAMDSAETALLNSGFKLGDRVILKTMSLAKNNKVMAIGVQTDCPSKNAIKHITIGVDRLAGGKPFHSNQLTDWQPIQNIELEAIIQECQ